MTECAYCGCAVEDHDPVFVEETDDDGTRVPAGAFCNYGCLASYIDAEGLTVGTSCVWTPE